MTTRVRYSNNNGTLTATNLVSSTLNDVLTVTLYPSTLTADITKSDSSLVTTVTGVSLAMLKKNVKTSLQANGVTFLNEVRNRTTSSQAA